MTFKQKVSRISIAYFVCFVLTVVFQSIFAICIKALAPNFMQNTIYSWLLTVLPLYLCAVPFFLLIMKTIPNSSDAPPKNKMSAKSYLKILAIVFAFTIVGNLISTLIALLISVIKGGEVVNPLASVVGAGNPIYTIIFGCIWVPIGEEFLFRVIPYKKLREYGEKPYILITALMFSLFHANLYQFIYAFLIGGVLAYVYSKTGNVLYNISLHMIINFYGMVLAVYLASIPSILIIFTIAVYVVVALGIYFAVKSSKNVVYESGITPLPPHPVKASIIDFGFILYAAVILIIAVMNIMI